MSKKESDKAMLENELSIGRWIVTFAAGLLIGLVFDTIIYVICRALTEHIPALQEGGSWYDMSTFITSFLSFAGFFWGLVIGITKVGRTTIKAFILNAGRQDKINISKEVLPILGLYLLGLLMSGITDYSYVTFTGKSVGKIIFLIIFSLVFIWMQTSWEEMLFRGFALRLLCKNNIGINMRSVIAAIVTSVVFMAGHLANPEVQSLSGFQVILAALSYFVAGIAMFICDMLVGSLLPGFLIHWLNNFFAMVIIGNAVAVAGASSIWVDTKESTGLSSLLSTLVAYVPVLIYLFIKWNKKQKAER